MTTLFSRKVRFSTMGVITLILAGAWFLFTALPQPVLATEVAFGTKITVDANFNGAHSVAAAERCR